MVNVWRKTLYTKQQSPPTNLQRFTLVRLGTHLNRGTARTSLPSTTEAKTKQHFPGTFGVSKTTTSRTPFHGDYWIQSKEVADRPQEPAPHATWKNAKSQWPIGVNFSTKDLSWTACARILKSSRLNAYQRKGNRINIHRWTFLCNCHFVLPIYNSFCCFMLDAYCHALIRF